MIPLRAVMKKNSKCFWKYINRCGCDNLGIQDVIRGSQIIFDHNEKANLFNEYFRFVCFPGDDMAPDISRTTFDVMEPLKISARGIKHFF